MNNILEKNISYLNLNKKTNEILIQNNIINISDLWIKNRKYLKEINISDKDIKDIIIKLELNGLELNKKYNK